MSSNLIRGGIAVVAATGLLLTIRSIDEIKYSHDGFSVRECEPAFRYVRSFTGVSYYLSQATDGALTCKLHTKASDSALNWYTYEDKGCDNKVDVIKPDEGDPVTIPAHLAKATQELGRYVGILDIPSIRSEWETDYRGSKKIEKPWETP